ncbi:MAG: glycerol-3-phosphate acyltransferase [Anaerolineales bacterium]|jgi:glycerol-3-phosphate acyltransferase PlsY|nr:glycerol-3-phosphate acyltransferase [Anaerolineales bacterium]
MTELSGLLWLLAAFLSGALPLSVWVAKLAGKDPRSVGDKNPGATNALKSGGKWIGLAALMLDVSKAALPVGLAYQIVGLRGPEMAAIALAPSLGHAYSPFLGFKGGKALATALGAWIGLTLWDVPLVALAGITLWFLLLKNAGWAVVLSLAGMAAYLVFFRPDPLLFWVLGLQAILLIWKHRQDLVIRNW